MSKTIFYIDGSSKCPDKIQNALTLLNINVTCFTSALECIESIKTKECHMLLSSAESDQHDGIKFISQVKKIIPSLPIVLLVNVGDIKTTVRAIKAGATDCLEKPVKKEHLPVIQSVLNKSVSQTKQLNKTLSDIELKILQLILAGRTNKEIALSLERSQRTIEVHRKSIMQKFNANNVVDLMRKSASIGLLEL